MKTYYIVYIFAHNNGNLIHQSMFINSTLSLDTKEGIEKLIIALQKDLNQSLTILNFIKVADYQCNFSVK